jgi:MFS transporter, DHA1 family, multidrug resistance protein
MLDLVRDSTVGGILNHISGGRILPYADQRAGYRPPNHSQSSARDEKALSSPASLHSPQDDLELGETKTPTPAKSDTAVSKEAHLSQTTVIDNAVDPNLIDWDGPDDPDNPM